MRKVLFLLALCASARGQKYETNDLNIWPKLELAVDLTNISRLHVTFSRKDVETLKAVAVKLPKGGALYEITACREGGGYAPVTYDLGLVEARLNAIIGVTSRPLAQMAIERTRGNGTRALRTGVKVFEMGVPIVLALAAGGKINLSSLPLGLLTGGSSLLSAWGSAEQKVISSDLRLLCSGGTPCWLSDITAGVTLERGKCIRNVLVYGRFDRRVPAAGELFIQE